MKWIITYLMAIIAANLSVAYFGPKFVVFNSFVLIGFDLFARDKLHEQWHNNHLKRNMGILILSGSVLSASLSLDVARVAVASFLAFSSTGMVDTFTYSKLWHRPIWQKMNASNLVSGFVDTVIFMSIAFGFPFLWWIAIQNYVAKVIGGLFWTICFEGVRPR